jgi:hypothetical protein
MLSILKMLVKTRRLRKMYRKVRKLRCMKDTLREHQAGCLRRRRKPNQPPPPQQRCAREV